MRMSLASFFKRWHEALSLRRSRRKYADAAPPPESMTRMEQCCAEFSAISDGARAVLISGKKASDEVFKGIVGSYGKVTDAPAFMAFVGDARNPHVQEKTGYLGECLVLEATALGLSTCWVAGFFRPEAAAKYIAPAAHEQVIAVTPLGIALPEYTLEERIMAGFAGPKHKRAPLRRLWSGMPEDMVPAWMWSAMEAARLAPSAVNRQPWRFLLDAEGITVAVGGLWDTYGISRRLDCGIAMLHLEAGAYVHGVRGGWTFLAPPDVARFCPEDALGGNAVDDR